MVAINFLGLLDAAEAEQRLKARSLGGHAVSQIFFDGQFQVRRHLGVHLAVHFGAAE